MSNNQEPAADYIAKLRKEFIEKHTKIQEERELIRINNNERDVIKGYHGREILELLQNADDAYQEYLLSCGTTNRKGTKVLIEYTSETLRICNTGTIFSQKGIRAIVYGNDSTKGQDNLYIGNKGTGFRSVLNWANKIRLFSGEWNLEFSKDNAKELLNEIKDSEQIRKQLEEKKNLFVPMLSVPKCIEPPKNKRYDTIIEIDVIPELLNDGFGVNEQIKELDFRFLLFLPNITEIEIRTDESIINYTKKILNLDSNIYELLHSVDGEINKQEKYYYRDKKIEKLIKVGDEHQGVKFGIGIPYFEPDEEIEEIANNKLYCFFPLKDSNSPFNLLLHATYDLSVNRNSLNLNDTNRIILQEQLKFIIELVDEFSTNKFNDLGTLIATPHGIKNDEFKFSGQLSEFSFKEDNNELSTENFYLKELSNCNFLPTINWEYISIKDNPKLITSTEIPSTFTGSEFSNLLQLMIFVENEALIAHLAKYNKVGINYTASELESKINLLSASWTAEQRIDTFLWWEKEQKKPNILPKLLKDNFNNWIPANEDIYFVRGRELNIPKWAKTKQLSSEDEKLLIGKVKQFDEFNKIFNEEKQSGKQPITERIISNLSGDAYNTLIPHIKFHDADAYSVISPINTSIENFEQSKEFLTWLFNNYSNIPDWTPKRDNKLLVLRLPNAQNEVTPSDELFFDSSYKNIGDKICSKINLKPFIDFEALGIDSSLKENFYAFSKILGIINFPQISRVQLTDQEFQEKCKKLLENHLSEIKETRTFNIVKLEFDTIIDLEVILNECKTEEIISWISNDHNLRQHIFNVHGNYGIITYRVGQKWSYDSFYHSVHSYISHVFCNTKWITISENRYSPNECLFSYPNIDISSTTPVLTNEYLNTMSKNTSLSIDKVKDILKFCGVKNKITDLPSSAFYSLLLKLPKIDASGSVSQKIYREIEEPDFNKKFEDCEERELFFNEGEVFTQNRDGKSYSAVSESFFSNKTELNVDNRHIMCTTIRKGNFDNFKNVFGVKKFIEEYAIIPDSENLSTVNDEFQKHFSFFIKYAKSWSERNDNIKQDINKLKVHIVSSIQILMNNESKIVTKNYTLLQGKNQNWYLVFSKECLNLLEISRSIEEIFDKMVNSPNSSIPGQLGELFRAPDEKHMKFLVEKEFGAILNQNAILKIFCKSLDLPEDDKNVQRINFDELASIDSLAIIVEILRNCKLDVDDLHKKGFDYEINLSPYWQDKIRALIESNEQNYKIILYNKFSNTAINEQKTFLREYFKFYRFQMDENDIPNTVLFSIEEYISGKFPDINEKIDFNLNVDDLYKKNFEEITNKIEDKYKSQFDDFLDSHPDKKSLVYFFKKDNEIGDVLVREFRESIQVKNEDSATTYTSSNINENDITITKPKISRGIAKDNSDNGRHSQGVPQGQIEKSEQMKNRNGEKAEKMVYQKLKNDDDYRELKWTSEKSTNSAEREPSNKYDLKYKKNGRDVYIEVKSATTEFFMSSSEYEFAKKHKMFYEIFLVDIQNKEICGPYSILDFEGSKVPSQYKFVFKKE